MSAAVRAKREEVSESIGSASPHPRARSSLSHLYIYLLKSLEPCQKLCLKKEAQNFMEHLEMAGPFWKTPVWALGFCLPQNHCG